MDRDKLWAPWRIKYIQGLNQKKGCFLCGDLESVADDEKNLVLWRTAHSIVVLNCYPYNNGHLLVAPNRHIEELDQASDEELLDLIKLVAQAKKALSLAIEPQGFNVGVNFGHCAGAGLPGHLHIHIVPRWEGDSNFINVCSDTDVISQSLTELFEQLKKVSQEHDLPGL